nr:MAG: putative RNA dependent RNA polymerase [Yunnan mito-like virus 30]
MKNIKISRIFNNTKERVANKLIRLSSLDKSLTLDSLLNRYGFKLVNLSLRDSGKKTANRLRLYLNFSKYLYSLQRRHGSVYVVKYLKACSLALSKALAGQPFSSLREIEPDLPLPRLTRSGIPVIIRTRDRRSLLSNNHKILRLYLSLFNLYRVISIESKLKLNTITDSYTGDYAYLYLFGSWLRRNSKSIIGSYISKKSLISRNYLYRETSSPTNSKSWLGLVRDAVLIANDKVLYDAFARYCKATNSTLIKWIDDFSAVIPETLLDCLPSKGLADFLGQLSLKAEPAGKMRVFAIVDGWTQSLFQPLHDNLFQILDNLPNDGKKDQKAAFERACSKATKYNCCFGYDLSAATDRLPIKLQVDILTSLFGYDMAAAWKDILVGRPYCLYDKKYRENEKFELYRYEVGQPMGALSSWAMLSLTHHMIMQFCSRLLNPSSKIWEDRYEVLGDDIVIFNKDLAMKYLEIMAKIGVPINESKSVVSECSPTVEFAKRTWKYKEVSPIPWKIFMSQDTWKGRLSAIIGLFNKEDSFLDKPFSVIYTILSRRSWDMRPKKDPLSLIALMNSYIGNDFNYLLRAVRWYEPMINKGKLYFANFNFELSQGIIVSLLKGRKKPHLPAKDANYMMFEWAVKEVLRARLKAIQTKYNDLWVERQVRKTVEAILSRSHLDPSGSKGGLFGGAIVNEKYEEYSCSDHCFENGNICFEHCKPYFKFTKHYQIPKEIYSKINFLVRQTLFLQSINTLTLWNDEVIDDPKVPLVVLKDILEEKMNMISSFEYVDRIEDPSPKLLAQQIDACEVLQLVLKGFRMQWDYDTNQTVPFDPDRFLKFIRKEVNYKPLSTVKGFESLNFD